MKNEAQKAVERKLAGCESEQSVKSLGGKPPKDFGHSSAKSGGVGGSIPKGKK